MRTPAHIAAVVVLGVAMAALAGGCAAPKPTRAENEPAAVAAVRPSLVATDQSVVKSTVPRKPGWLAEDARTPRYAEDGRGIYYVLGWVSRTMADDRKDDLVYVADIHSKPVVLSARSAGIPADVAESGFASIDIGNGRPDATNIDFLAASPDHRFWIPESAAVALDGPRLWLFAVDKTPARKVTTWDSADGLDAAGWLDTRTVLAGVSGLPDGSCILDLVDVDTGKTETVFRVPKVGENRPSIERIVVDPDGFAVFSVHTPGDSESSSLFRYDVATRKVTALARVPLDGWDYSPSRNRLVTEQEESPRLVERPLPNP